MTAREPEQQEPFEERLEDHLDRRITGLVARALRGEVGTPAGQRLHNVAGGLHHLLGVALLLEDSRSPGERFIDAIQHAHRTNTALMDSGEDAQCGCRLTPDCVRKGVSPRLLARLSGFGQERDSELREMDVTGAADPADRLPADWQTVRDHRVFQRRIVPRAQDKLAQALVWAFYDVTDEPAFEVGEAAAALKDLKWLGRDPADEFFNAVSVAHDRLHDLREDGGFGARPGSCGCRLTADCYSPSISPRSVMSKLIHQGPISELDDEALDRRLVAADVTGRPDPADQIHDAPSEPVAAPVPVPGGPAASPTRDSREEVAELQAEILVVLRASSQSMRARDIAGAIEADIDGHRAGQLLRSLRQRGLVERHTFSDENTGWTHTTWTAVHGDRD